MWRVRIWFTDRAKNEPGRESAAVARRAVAGLAVALATVLSGCDRPEGLGTVDPDAARQAMIAQHQPDPLAPAGQAKFQMPPTGRKRSAVARPRPR
jgi:hypothetical protein